MADMEKEKLKSTFKISGVVILYNSSVDVLDNIKTYIDQVEKLYVVDNSEKLNSELIELLKLLPKVKYISNKGNQGVANALNVAAQYAENDGFTHLLTMDDDSKAPMLMISTMLDFLLNYFNSEKVGIVSPMHEIGDKIAESGYKKELFTMTSGNLLNLTIYKSIGGFWEDLFIDHVDHEYGLRLNKYGYEVIVISSIKLLHQLGEEKKKVGVKYVSHSPIRYYYFVRNGIVLCKAYYKEFPSFLVFYTKRLLIETIKSFLLENKKYDRTKYLYKAIQDGLKSRLGKYQQV